MSPHNFSLMISSKKKRKKNVKLITVIKKKRKRKLKEIIRERKLNNKFMNVLYI